MYNKTKRTFGDDFVKNALAVILCVVLALSAAPAVYASSAGQSAPESENLYIPQLHINTESGNGTSLQKEDGYVNADYSVDDDKPEPVAVKVRGNSTAMTAKKSFTFKFDSKKDLFGMGNGKKWVLLANAFDPTLLRNYIAFDFARELGIDYTSNQKIVELWLDGKFRGCYTLMEPVQEGKDRVDIDTDGNKDFMLEYERLRTDEGTTYITAGGLRFGISEPDEPDTDQVSYITETMERLTNIIDSGSEKEIKVNIDVDSFVKFYVLNEYIKTNDFDFSSVFFYYKDGKLYAGPPWDYDLTMGNVNKDFSANSAAAFKTDGEYINSKLFYKKLCSYGWFMDKVRLEYEHHSRYIRKLYADGGLIDTLANKYSEVFSRNYNEAGWSFRYLINVMMYPFPTYGENLDFLKNWCENRDKWLSQFYGIDLLPYRLGDCDGNGVVNVNDATMIQKYAAMLITFSDEQKSAADINRDGKINIGDATSIQRVAAH